MKSYGPIKYKNIGEILSATLAGGSEQFIVDVDGFSEMGLSSTIENYSSLAKIDATFEASYNSGLTWYNITDDSGENDLVLSKTISGNVKWLWTVKSRAQLIRVTFVPTSPGGESLSVVATASAVPVKAQAAQSGGGGGPVTAHHTTHESGGSDEINVTGLNGVLLDHQHPIRSAQTVIVAKSGGDFTSINAAMTSITDAANVKPYVIIVESGLFSELPVLMKPFVKIVGRSDNSIVVAGNNSAPLFDMADNSSIENISLSGPTSDVTVQASGKTRVGVKNCVFFQGQQAIEINNSDAFVENCKSLSGVNIFLNISNGATVSANGLLSYSQISFQCSGSELWVHNSGVAGGSYGLTVDLGGSVYPSNITFNNCQTVIHTGSTGINRVVGNSIVSKGLSNFDVLQESGTSEISLTGCSLDEHKIQADDFTNINIQFSSRTEEQETFISTVSTSTGVPEYGQESHMGEGRETSRGIRVYEYLNSSGVFTNVTPAAKSATGSTFGIPGTSVNDALYVSWDLDDQETFDKKKFFGSMFDIVQAADLGGTGEIVIEFWDGSTWSWLNTMSTQETGKKLPFTNYEIFQRIGKESVRFDKRLDDQWVKNDPVSLGSIQYWIRFRVAVAITTEPIFELLKLHPSHTHIGHDGWIMFHGKARPLRYVEWNLGLLEGFYHPPAAADLYLGDRLGCGLKMNRFVSGSEDLSGLNTYLPLDIDTSCPIVLKWSFVGSDNDPTNHSDWTIRWGWTYDGEDVFFSRSQAPVAGSNEQSVNVSILIPARRIQNTFSVELDVSEMKSRRDNGNGDVLWISILRHGNTDAYSGDIALMSLVPYYTAWNLGGHE